MFDGGWKQIRISLEGAVTRTHKLLIGILKSFIIHEEHFYKSSQTHMHNTAEDFFTDP